MGSQKPSRRWIGRGWLGGAFALGLLTVNCAPDYVKGNSGPVNFYIVAVSPNVLASDIRGGSKQAADGSGPLFTCPDFAKVSVAVRNKNPMAPAPNVAAAVIVDSYTVRYFRTDGRGVEGVDVPYRITGNLTAGFDVKSSGTDDVSIEVVRHQAKSEPPLSTIFQTSVLTLMAEVTLYGSTIAGEKVSASGRMQIDFADYGDTDTACKAIS
jgi:hypothetical protein